MILGAIEAGGTKFVLAVGNEKGELTEKLSIPTRTPEETMPEIYAFFKDKNIEALGIGCFGPLELNKEKEKYGYITSTPKLAWADYDILGNLKKNLKVPVEISTDVSGAALGEVTFGAYEKENTLLYITVGTGIGGDTSSTEKSTTACFIRKWVMFWSRRTQEIPIRAPALITRTAWKALRQVLPTKEEPA